MGVPVVGDPYLVINGLKIFLQGHDILTYAHRIGEFSRHPAQGDRRR